MSNLTLAFLMSTTFPADSMDTGFRRAPETNPFFVFRTLLKDNVVEPFDR